MKFVLTIAKIEKNDKKGCRSHLVNFFTNLVR